MFVAASTNCFSDLSLPDAIGRLVDLEYSNVEIALDERLDHLKPSQVLADLEQAINICRNTSRLDICALNFFSTASEELYYQQFAACCKLAKAIKVVTLIVPSGKQGTPFNEEVEHLRQLVAIASVEGIRVALKTELGCLSQDPDTLKVLCNNVKELGIALDPTHFITRDDGPICFESLYPMTYHVHLRDSSKDQFQVQIGRGEVDYGKIINQLRKQGYDYAYSVCLSPLEETDHTAEMRKLRLLLESLML